ncbi:MAG: hypothetical protein IPL98_05125 [Saprospiraceae bacterium]|nr:hypothetical protein [Saprospiraceae bacterium]
MQATIHTDADSYPNRKEIAKNFFLVCSLIESNNPNTAFGLKEAYEVIKSFYSTNKSTLTETNRNLVEKKLWNSKYSTFKGESSVTKFLKGEGKDEIEEEEKNAWIEFLYLLKNNHSEIKMNNGEVSKSNYSEELLNSLYEKFKNKENNSTNPIITYFSKEYALSDKSISQFLMAFPDGLWHYINNRSNNEKTVSDQIDFNSPENIKSNTHNGLPQYEIKDFKSYKDLNEFDNFYFGQSQNPNKEQLSLILEYGKLFRIKDVFNKDLKIIFSDIEWSNLNEVYKLDKEEDLSEKNINFRKDILNKLGIENSTLNGKSTIRNVVKDYSNQLKIKDYDDIEVFKAECRFLFSLYQFIKESDFYGSNNQVSIPDSKDFYGIDSMREFNNAAKKTSNLIIHPLYSKFPLEIISIVHSHFKAKIDENTFFYILIQKMAQFTFKNSLKLGVASEYRFDESFMRWDKLMGQFYTDETTIERTSIYYSHYFWGGDKTKWTLPYYWPSGELNNKIYSNKNEIERQIILLDDDNSKVTSLINSTPIDEILRQLSDLLSFLHFYIKGEQDTELLKIFNDFDIRLKEAFCIEKANEIPTNQFLGLFMYKYKMPYYIFPYISLLSAEKTESDIKKLFISLVNHTIKILKYNK